VIAARYRMLGTTCAIAAAVAVAIGTRARAGQSALDQMPSGLVRVDAMVENSIGQFAPGLTRDDFEIAVDGQPRPVEWLSSDPSPLALAVLVDISGSQSPGDQNRATVYAPNMINPGGRVFGPSPSIQQFNLYGIQGWDRVRAGAIGARLSLSSRFADNSGDLQREWSLVFNQAPARWYEGSAIWDAVAGASTVFTNVTGRPAIILVTDGEASGNLVSSRDAADRAALAGVSVSVVAEEAVLGFGPDAARKYGPGVDLVSRGIDPTKNLKMLAEATGGLYALDEQNRRSPFSARTPAPFVAHAIDALHHAYTLGFRPSAVDDTVHSLTVRVRKPGLVAHARQTFRAAPPPAPAASSAGAAHASAAVERPPFNILGPAGAMDLTRVQEWIAAVAAHQPGVADAPAVKISQWPPAFVAETVDDVAALARAVAYRHGIENACIEAVKTKSGDPMRDCAPQAVEVLFYRDAVVPPGPALDALFGLSDAEILAGNANRVLERGALLHTDIALLAAKNAALVNHAPSTTSAAAARISDGEVMAIEDTSHHWAAARRLLDSVESNPDRFRTLDWTDDVGGDPSRDELVRDWYRLTSAFHLTELHYQYATPGLVRGSEIFPADPILLFYRGVMHEVFAMPLHQGAAQSLIRVGASLSVQAPSLELQQAEHDLRLAVAGDPSQVEARVRLGRVLSLRGRHDEAMRQLEQARDAAAKEPRLAYLAALFLGRELETAGDVAGARASFERAAALFPQAQAPLVAQSALGRRAGEPADALPALQQLFAKPSNGNEDPWWSYGLPQFGVPEAIIARLRYEFVERTAR